MRWSILCCTDAAKYTQNEKKECEPAEAFVLSLLRIFLIDRDVHNSFQIMKTELLISTAGQIAHQRYEHYIIAVHRYRKLDCAIGPASHELVRFRSILREIV